MTISAHTISLLIDAGLGGDTLKNILAAIESDVTERNALREHVTLSDAGSVTPAALRMRKMRENKRLSGEIGSGTGRNGVTEHRVTSNNILSLEVKGIEEKKTGIARVRKKYPEVFDKFWRLYPTDAGMSKSEAFKGWEKLTEDEQGLAIMAIPAFKRWIEKQGENYRIVHACRFITQRRFEGFKDEAERMQERASSTVYVKYGTDAGDAWELFYKTEKHKIAPRDSKGGWYFPTQFPPSQTGQAPV